MATYKGVMLLEADPTANYERGVKEFAQDMVKEGRLVYAFTSRGSPVHLLLKDVPGLKFFILSESSYPKQSAGSPEVMVPRSDHSVLLDVTDKAVTGNPPPATAIIFDNISSLILDSGFPECYKFIRQMNEILSRGNVTSIFLVLSKAHDDKTMSILRNLYSGHLTYDKSGMRVTKQT